MYKNILVPVDLADEDRAKQIVSIGARLLDAGGKLRLLHVVPSMPAYGEAYLPGTIYEEGLQFSEAKMKEIAGALKVEAEIASVVGVPHVEILERARQSPPDLIIIGSHRPGLSDYFLGSTAARVVRHAQCPVLVDR